MKKIGIVLACAVCAAFANAASVNWAVTSSNADAAGLKVYICSQIADFANESEIGNYLYGGSGNTGSLVAGRSGATATGKVGGISDSLVGSTTLNFVIVSADGKGYYTGSAVGEVYTTATQPTPAEWNASDALAGNYTPWKQDDPPGPDPIPEPTTGLLFVLGAGLMALRRKAK